LEALRRKMDEPATLSEQYVTDADGKRIAVIVPIEVYERLLDAYEDMEDLAAIREYEAAKAAGEDLGAIPFEQFVEEYEARHSAAVQKAD
jgi:hypothetical protein